MLVSREELYAFAAIAKSPPTGYTPVTDLVQSLSVRSVGAPTQPWIHLVPVVLNRYFSRRLPGSYSLEVGMKPTSLGGSLRDHISMHLTHDSLPRPLSAFGGQFSRVDLHGIDFRRPANFLRFIRSFRYAETLQCFKIRCLEYATQLELYQPSRDPPLRRISFQVWPLEGSSKASPRPLPTWISVLWSVVRRRHDLANEYLLEDDETLLVMRITSFSNGFYRRKHVPLVELTVQERRTVGMPLSPLHGSPFTLHRVSVPLLTENRF